MKSLRESDLAARFGGDEFIVLLEEVANRNDAMAVRDELERVLATPLQSLVNIAADVVTFAAGAAIGIALCPEEGRDLETLLKRADEDMYLRKQARAAKLSELATQIATDASIARGSSPDLSKQAQSGCATPLLAVKNTSVVRLVRPAGRSIHATHCDKSHVRQGITFI